MTERSNNYVVMSSDCWGTCAEYKGTNLQDALNVFKALDNGHTKVWFYINNELVEL